MRVARHVYRWGFIDRCDPIGIDYGVVEIIYNDGRVEELEVGDIKELTIHHRYPEEVPSCP